MPSKLNENIVIKNEKSKNTTQQNKIALHEIQSNKKIVQINDKKRSDHSDTFDSTNSRDLSEIYDTIDLYLEHDYPNYLSNENLSLSKLRNLSRMSSGIG